MASERRWWVLWWNRLIRSRLPARFDRNEYGTRVSVHWCHRCGQRFTLCPGWTPAKAWRGSGRSFGGCLADICESYDINRDVDMWLLDGGRLARDDDDG